MTDRIESIRKMLEGEPDDVFLHYSLGMEYASAERYDEAVSEFRRCIEIDGGYVAAHVEVGKCLRAAGDLSGAREAFLRGLEVASGKGEKHVEDFIRQQLRGLPE